MNLPEPYEFLIENSIEKAKDAIKQRPEYDYALGDDSGVFIEELDYMPGVHSRRWFGEETDDHGRNQKILEMMRNASNRDAYLISRFALVDKIGKLVAKKSVKNHFIISDSERGADGFGYDKILIPYVDLSGEQNENNMFSNLFLNDRDMSYLFYGDKHDFDFDHTTIGEMSQEQKNAITYRGRIAKYFAEVLENGM